jgi:hypothetical protein
VGQNSLLINQITPQQEKNFKVGQNPLLFTSAGKIFKVGQNSLT